VACLAAVLGDLRPGPCRQPALRHLDPGGDAPADRHRLRLALFTAASYVTTLSLWAALVLHALFDGLGLGRLHPSSTRADAAVLGVLLAGAGVLGSRVARTTLPTTVTSEPATPSARSEGKRPASSAGTRPVGLLDSGVPRRDVLQPCRHWIRPAGAQAAAHQALEGTDRPRRMCHSDDGNSLVRIEPARQ